MLDVNECEVQNDCAHNCTNSHGSYYCSCAMGYVLDETKKLCFGEICFELQLIFVILLIIVITLICWYMFTCFC